MKQAEVPINEADAVWNEKIGFLPSVPSENMREL